MTELAGHMRTHHCGELSSKNIGESVTLCGWVNKYRDLGGLHFIDIRDKHGLTQLGFEEFKGDLEILKTLGLESVIMVKGTVRKRPDSALNKKMKTGEIEVAVQDIELLSKASPPPFLPHGKIEATEDLRLKYRYIDIRTEKLQKIIALRSNTARETRNVLYNEGFVEVETPILYKTTPEGARDYVVPSRVHPGKVYALPQSPQTLKQLLMIGNTDKYFQICRCFRDEDLRADRQPEFTQVDIEVSFSTTAYMKNLVTKLLTQWFDLDKDFSLQEMTYDEAMNRFGTDRPDMRFGLEHMNVTHVFENSEFGTFKTVAEKEGLIKAIFVDSSKGQFSRKVIDGLVEVVKPYGGKGVAWFKVDESQNTSGGISKFINEETLKKLNTLLEGSQDGTWFFIADESPSVVHASADALRKHFGKELNLYSKEYAFIWITDFPLLDYDEEAGRFVACHHPFTMPHKEDLDKFFDGNNEDLRSVRAQAYDIVCNGYEIGGGSMRIFDQKVQSQMFRVLGMTEEETLHQFGFFIEALKFGTPPHGGIAFGLDRLIMLQAKTDSIRDVIAFPKTTSATDLMAQSPSAPKDEQLKELHMSFTKK